MEKKKHTIICERTCYIWAVRAVSLTIFALCLAALAIGYFEARPQRIARTEKTKVEVMEIVEVVEVIKEVEVGSDAGEWKNFTVTAYTSHDKGVGKVSAIGLDIAHWDRYFGFCAVDPKVIGYGSVVLVEFEKGVVKPFLAVDCGYAIKGKRLDLYFGYEQDKALQFGVKNLRVKVVE